MGLEELVQRLQGGKEFSRFRKLKVLCVLGLRRRVGDESEGGLVSFPLKYHLPLMSPLGEMLPP